MSGNTTTWFITGASAGFGLAFAHYAVSKGYNVVATARNPGKLASLVAKAPEQVLAYTLDVTDPNSAEKAVAAAVERFGKIDVVINNAGHGMVGALEETPDIELRSIMETNFFGVVNVTKAVLPVLRKQKQGAIVNVTSMGGQLSFAGFSAYSATKFAVEGMSEALVQEVKSFGIKVMIVEPGQFRTDFATSSLRHMPVMDVYLPIIKEYRDFAHNMNGTQPGDPFKAAAAIDLALQAEKTPFRLQLGDDAIDGIREHSETLLADMKLWESVSRYCNIDRAN